LGNVVTLCIVDNWNWKVLYINDKATNLSTKNAGRFIGIMIGLFATSTLSK